MSLCRSEEYFHFTRANVFMDISGLTGMLQFNENGDRMAEYAIHDFNSTGQMDVRQYKLPFRKIRKNY